MIKHGWASHHRLTVKMLENPEVAGPPGCGTRDTKSPERTKGQGCRAGPSHVASSNLDIPERASEGGIFFGSIDHVPFQLAPGIFVYGEGVRSLTTAVDTAGT